LTAHPPRNIKALLFDLHLSTKISGQPSLSDSLRWLAHKEIIHLVREHLPRLVESRRVVRPGCLRCLQLPRCCRAVHGHRTAIFAAARKDFRPSHHSHRTTIGSRISVCHKPPSVSESCLRHQAIMPMTDFNPDSVGLPDSMPSSQHWGRWRGRLKLLARSALWLLSRGLIRIPEDDYGAKDLDGGGFQTLFGSHKDKKGR
jgi:hypothetical protein